MTHKSPNTSVVATAGSVGSSLRSGRLLAAVPHLGRSPKNLNIMFRLSSKSSLIFFALVATLSCFPTLALATSNYEYGADEYVTITKGLSPDGRFAITAHGEGDDGYGNFHLYLTNAVTGRRIGKLEEVDPILDTDADSFGAIWSKDSGKVTIVWRWSRHGPLKSITYKITPKAAFPKTKKAVDIDDESKLAEFWRSTGSTPTEKRFGSPKKK